MGHKELLAMLALIVLTPIATVGTLQYFSPPDPGHLEWCERVEYRSDSCTLDHWPGRLKLMGIGLGTVALIGLFTLGAQADVDRRFHKIEAKHRKENRNVL
jgi:hypothetical protein